MNPVTQTLFFPTEADLLQFAAKLSQQIHSGMIIFLSGPLGAGKTTFVRGFLRGLGHTGKVKSPTYTLLEPYELFQQALFHFDLYRLHHPDELLEIGLTEYFTPQAICLVEWPEKGIPLLPTPDLTCYISVSEEGRMIRLQALTERAVQAIVSTRPS